MFLKDQFGTETLGNQFLMTIPCNYQIFPHPGPDYQDYSLLPIDTSNKNLCRAGIIFGNNVGAMGQFIDKKSRKDTLVSNILGRNVDWVVYDLDTVLFAECFVDGEYCATIEIEKS